VPPGPYAYVKITHYNRIYDDLVKLCPVFKVARSFSNAVQMLKNISKSVCVSLGFFPSILNSFSATLASKLSQKFVLFLLLRSLENSSNNKSMRLV
jgi:hypothetical protein